MFRSIPNEQIHAHDWRGGCISVGQVSADTVRAESAVSSGSVAAALPNLPRALAALLRTQGSASASAPMSALVA